MREAGTKPLAEMLGVVDYLRKLFAMEALLASVQRVLDPDGNSADRRTRNLPLPLTASVTIAKTDRQ